MINEFINYLEEQIGQPYVWGAQHLRLRPSDYVSIITRKEENARHEKNAIEFCRKKFANGAKELHAFDCSGLGMYWLQNKQKLYKYDMNANSMMAKCTMVSTKPKKGYWVFRVSGTRATHIGYMVDDTHVVHSKGREYGVVKEQYSSYYWHAVGIPNVFSEEIIGKSANDIFVFKRALKYRSTGEDVKQLKKLLLAKGYGGLTTSNGNFYSATSKVVKQFQKDKGLVVDGIAGKKTITALGGVWEG